MGAIAAKTSLNQFLQKYELKGSVENMHSISNWNFCCFSFITDTVHQNSLTVEFLQEKIECNLKRANKEPSVDFRRTNTELSVDFRKANTEQSVNFRRDNTETYWK